MTAFRIALANLRYPPGRRSPPRRGAPALSHRPSSFGEPASSFHEKAALCRAAENTCYFATVNYASAGSPTTSAVVRPDGTLLVYQPYGEAGLLVTDIDLAAATGLLASRYKPVQAGPHVTARRDPERDPSLMDPSP